MKYTYLQDVEERKRQYIKAIDYYLKNTKYRIVFCENTGADVTELKKIKNANRVEFISFVGNDYDSNLGKGYGEFMIIQEAFKRSLFIKKSSKVIKITGRLIVDNLTEIVKWHGIIFGNSNNFFFGSGNQDFKEFNSRCFIASKKFISEVFLTENNVINDSKGYYFEHYLYDCVNRLPKDFIVSDFVIPISIVGQSGTSGDYFNGVYLNRYEKLRLIRDFCQRNKIAFLNDKQMVYYRMSIVSFLVRVAKAFVK